MALERTSISWFRLQLRYWIPTWYTHEPRHRPIGSKPALRTSKNSLMEKSEVKTPVASAVLRSPCRRCAACAGITSSAISDGSLRLIGLVGLVMTCVRQRFAAGMQIHHDADVMGQRR